MSDIETFAELTIQRMNDVVKKHSRNWLIAFGLAVILLIVMIVTVFRKTTESDSLTLLKQQQQFLDSLSNQQKRIAEQDRLRDSVYWTNYVQNSKAREGQLLQTKKRTDEIINHINQPEFNADSIKSWWSNN